MKVKILGSAAGGGFPQWNCACPNCRAVRAGTFQGKPRTQAQVAISADGESWYLLGASPDLRAQIEATPELQPRGEGVRQSPVKRAVLLNADIDHVLGLLLMRELQPLRIHATESVRRILTEDNSMFGMLQRVPGQLSWTMISARESVEITPKVCHSERFRRADRRAPSEAEGEESAVPTIRFRALSLGTHFPAHISEQRRSELRPEEASLGLIVESNSGKRLAYTPAVPQITDELLGELASADVLLFDGTFWSDDELIRIQGSGQTAQQMGHVPVSGPDGSLRRLAHLRHPRKIYIHVNNTNPMLNEVGPEHRQVREAGWEIAEDGWQFEL